MTLTFRAALSSALAALTLAACSQPAGNAAEDGKVLNLYTARHYDADRVLYDRFTEETGIKINLIEGNASELIARMRSEGQSSSADVFVAADAGALWQAQDAGLLQSTTDSAVLNQRIPANLRAADGQWFGFSRRARVVAYDQAKVRPDEVDTYEELASPRFRGKLCVRTGDNVYNLSLLGALIEAWGPERARAWADGIVANMARPPEGGDRDQIRAIAAGVCEVALTNSYYYIRMANGDDAGDRNVTRTVKLHFPSLDEQGAHVNVSGGGVARHAPNRANAVRFLEFLASDASQQTVSSLNFEFPAVPSVAAPPPVNAYAGFTPHPMSVALYGPRQAEARSIMSAAGWR